MSLGDGAGRRQTHPAPLPAADPNGTIGGGEEGMADAPILLIGDAMRRIAAKPYAPPAA